jgi:serine/threonine protein kinase
MSGRRLLPFLALVLALYSASTITHVAGQNGTSTSFSFDVNTDNAMDTFTFVGDAESLDAISPIILLCSNALPTTHGSTGRALYKHPVQFFQEPDSSQLVPRLASFSTSFSFTILMPYTTYVGDGLAFVIVSSNATDPTVASGGWMGLANSTDNGNASNHLFAVEFDTFYNPEFGDPSDSHIGVDVNGVRSIQTYNLCSDSGSSSTNCSYFRESDSNLHGWIDYTAETGSLEVYFSNETSKPQSPQLVVNNFNLSEFLVPDGYMYVGFSASNPGLSNSNSSISYADFELYSWTFNSSFNSLKSVMSPASAPFVQKLGGRGKGLVSLIIAICVGAVVGILVLIVVVFICCKICARRRGHGLVAVDSRGRPLNYKNIQFEQFLHGPRKFSHRELSIATNAFSPQELLGRGEFGCVYKGMLRDTKALVAVKKISKDSQQGGNEFLAELSIISRIQHRNLVKLQGWCSERGELMLVYDYMPNKSLDKLLFQNCSELAIADHHQNSTAMKLDWGMRHNILLEVASALAYLHEDWSEHRVVHRDVKASNVMLDKDFNACLGDFGLARLIEHSKEDADTTLVAGTVGYLAPELARIGKATTMSDVFSYGALALEVACGRRPFDRKFPEEQIVLLDWVWNCYENGELLKVLDSRLGHNFNEEQMTKVLLLGLLCSHPDPNARPPMGYVRQVLVGNASLPPLPLAKPTYISQELIAFQDLLDSSTPSMIIDSRSLTPYPSFIESHNHDSTLLCSTSSNISVQSL